MIVQTWNYNLIWTLSIPPKKIQNLPMQLDTIIFLIMMLFFRGIKGEYFQQKADGVKQDLENKGMLHLRYTHPVKSFFVEAFIQNEFDDFRALENRQLIGGGVRFH